ncbi:hypothetical protein NKI95_22880 [Mesorhizobium sp. M0306]|uniref:hypothetical protein n=1 Tax=Mesorhizobium sp. M0306 TaxID=2956932 RepID=UPI00333AC405
MSATAFAGALDVVDNIRPFYTDSSMKTLKPMPEFKVVFMAMPKAQRNMIQRNMIQRNMMMRECQDAAQGKPYAEFCGDVNALAGMK